MARVLLSTLLALAAGVQPMVVFAAEIHESSHGASHEVSPAQPEHGSHGHAHDDPRAPAEPLDPSDRWHVLMHFGHCCGQGVALLPVSFACDAATAPTPCPGADSPRPPSAESSLLLRPPIQG